MLDDFVLVPSVPVDQCTLYWMRLFDETCITVPRLLQCAYTLLNCMLQSRRVRIGKPPYIVFGGTANNTPDTFEYYICLSWLPTISRETVRWELRVLHQPDDDPLVEHVCTFRQPMWNSNTDTAEDAETKALLSNDAVKDSVWAGKKAILFRYSVPLKRTALRLAACPALFSNADHIGALEARNTQVVMQLNSFPFA